MTAVDIETCVSCGHANREREVTMPSMIAEHNPTHVEPQQNDWRRFYFVTTISGAYDRGYFGPMKDLPKDLRKDILPGNIKRAISVILQLEGVVDMYVQITKSSALVVSGYVSIKSPRLGEDSRFYNRVIDLIAQM